MKFTSGIFLALIYVISIAFYYLDKSETLKYFQYLLPCVGLFVSLYKLQRTWYVSGDLAKLSWVVLFISFLNLLMLLYKGDFYFRFLQEGFLFVGALLFAITLIGNLTHDISKVLNYSLYALVGIFILDKGYVLLEVLSNPDRLILGLITSTIQTESSLSFYFAILSVYFFFEKDRKNLFWATLFMVLSFKRIAILGFLLSVSISFIFKIFNIKYNRTFYSVLLTAFNFTYLWILLMLIDGGFDQFIIDTFGVSPNFLFMGRIDLYNNVLDETGYLNLMGIGIGKISSILGKFSESGIGEGVLVNLHSDILKYYLELGVIIFPIFLYKFIYYLSKNKDTFCLVVMLNIILLTDNVSIYFGFMVLLYLINFKLGYYSKENMVSLKLHTRKIKSLSEESNKIPPSSAIELQVV